MKFYEAEKPAWHLYDTHLPPYEPKGKDWLSLIKRGDCELIPELPKLSYLKLIDYILSHRYIMTMSSLDDLFRSFPPEVNSQLSVFGDTAEGLRVRPVSRRGISKVSAHVGPYHGYIFDMSEYVTSLDGIVPLLEALQRLGCMIDTFTTTAGIARAALLSRTPKAFRGLNKIDPTHLQRAASVFRLGRNEAFRIGTEQASTVLDMVSAYPYEVSQLQTTNPGFTYWTNTTSYDPKACYGFYEIEERTDSSQLSLISHRVELPGQRRQFFPGSGTRRGFVGKAMLELRLRSGYNIGQDIKIIGASQGYAKIEAHPFERLMLEFFGLRKTPLKTFFKNVDTRMVGSMAATYMKVTRPDANGPGGVLKIALPTYNPVYAAAAVDRVLAKICTLALQFPQERLIGFSIDGLQLVGDVAYPSDGEPGDIVKKYSGPTSRFTDLFGDKDGGSKWKDRLQNNKLVIPRRRHTLVGSFRPHLDDLDAAAKLFQDTSEHCIEIDAKSTKRKTPKVSGVDITKESYPTTAIGMGDIPILCLSDEVVLEEEGDDKL